MSEITERVIQIVAVQFDVKESDVVEGTRIVADLEADSLDRVELMMAFEEEFDLEIPEGPAVNVETIEDVVVLLEKQLRK